MKNKTIAMEFILLGFSNELTINQFLFVLFFWIYLLIIIGNGLIILVIIIYPHLHSPMYFFLSNLSFIDVCYSSSALPRLLVDLLSTCRKISLAACLTQIHMLLLMGATEYQLLALMAYDRYLAICHPLHYPTLMRWSICYRLTSLVWIFSFIIILVPSIVMPETLWCGAHEINHFMCEALEVLQLSCDKNDAKELLIFLLSFVTILIPFLLILTSYVCILLSILKIRSVGRSKAFSTCTSHITVVALFFGTGMITYLGSLSCHSPNQGKYISIFYVIVPPMLNPLIYSLNNREVKIALSKSLNNFLIMY
ncbi:unnamed protein product [Staurois parvus]|uniref:Olfactory receptor n=1 Tax=Staurois parvus TaxID=386267 RepID=A0ABN9GEV4_9NEOB|nr:unnamed protein product [Staurois parvus]